MVISKILLTFVRTIGLHFTGNNDAERAMNWILEHAVCEYAQFFLLFELMRSTKDDADANAPLQLTAPAKPAAAAGLTRGAGGGGSQAAAAADADLWKMVLVVRDDLNMGVGKIAAQCSHAGTASAIHRFDFLFDLLFDLLLAQAQAHT